MAELHRATIGVFGILRDKDGRGLWSKRTDGKGINAMGGRVDPEDVEAGRTLEEVLQREFEEESGLQVRVGKILGIFPTGNLGDLAILYKVWLIGGDLVVSDEASEHIWMTPDDIVAAADRYDEGDTANGLVSGRGKRQWQMAMTLFRDPGVNMAFTQQAIALMNA